jgi:hypothetical protein
VAAEDAAAGVITNVTVQAALTADPALNETIGACSLPDVPVYTGSVVQAAGVALAAGETKYLSGETVLKNISKHTCAWAGLSKDVMSSNACHIGLINGCVSTTAHTRQHPSGSSQASSWGILQAKHFVI